MKETNTQVIFKTRPEGCPTDSNFEIVQNAVPAAGDGQVLRKTIYLSVDPYMRGRMSTARSYAEPAKLGEPMVGSTISEVVESAGSDEKCAYVVNDLGFDVCINYKTADLKDAFKTACSKGIDVYFDNV